MNYQAIYNRLIERAKYKVLEDYCEIHHILPKCMGGTDELENLVKLTAEEHYVAHQLLVKIHPSVSGLIYAALCMTGRPYGQRSSNKVYGWLRKRASIDKRKIRLSEETKKKISAASRGRKHTAETKAKIAASQLGLNKGAKHTAESKLKISQAAKTRSPETRKKLSDAAKKQWERKRTENGRGSKSA